ncbi:MAG TPA: ABC transporter permease subunit [Bryobacteraceae bacterium]|nr:ABC transporter permease subunit [Bryobacteraceae bacterium]
MAVYKRSYRAYNGPLTDPLWRFMVLQRYALKGVFRSRMLLIGYIACFFFPVMALCLLYLNQNAGILAQINSKPNFVKVDGNFFLVFLQIQGALAGLVTAFVGPSLVAPDLTNGALPLYLSRPISRTEYIAGKGMVLGSLIASITLIPALLLFSVQSSLVGYAWFSENLFVANGILWISLLLMTLLILLGLAMSAWVRWRIVAGALVLGVFVAGKGFAAVINAAMRTETGDYLDLQHLLGTIGGNLLHHVAEDEPVPLYAAWIAILAFCGILLMLINRKLKVCEAAG